MAGSPGWFRWGWAGFEDSGYHWGEADHSEQTPTSQVDSELPPCPLLESADDLADLAPLRWAVEDHCHLIPGSPAELRLQEVERHAQICREKVQEALLPNKQLLEEDGDPHSVLHLCLRCPHRVPKSHP